MEKGSPSPSRSPIPAENFYSGRYGTSPPPDARPAILPGRARSGKGQAAKESQPVRHVPQATGNGWQCVGPKGILKRKNGRRAEDAFCLQPLEEQAEGGAGLVRYIIELQKMVEDVPAGFSSSEKTFPFLRKKTAAQKPGDRHQGKGSCAGQAVRDLMERFWKGEGAWGRGRTFSPKRFPSPPRLIFKLQWQPRS